LSENHRVFLLSGLWLVWALISLGCGGAASPNPGSTPTANLGANPATLSFGNVTVGTTSTQKVVLTNTGQASVTVSAANLSGSAFSISGLALPLTLAPGQNTSVNVSFTPTSAGNSSGSVSVVNNGPVSPMLVSLSGIGVGAAQASLSPTSLSFGSVTLGNTASQTVTLTNSGGSALNISAVSSNGDFTNHNNCPSSLAAGGSCTLTVTFTPSAVGARSGTLSVSDDASGSPQQATLSGTGVNTPVPGASLSSANVVFGSLVVNTTSAAQALTLTNTGNAALSITGISSSGDFAQTNNCPASLAASATCTINLTFTPTAVGSRTGTLSITDNAGSSPQQAALSGTGVNTPTPSVSLAPTNLSFGNELIGSTTTSQAVVLTNNGSAALSISGLASSGDFAQSNNCPASLAVNASCTINLTFTPTASGSRTGALSISDNASGSPQQVALSGTGYLQHRVDLTWNASTSTVAGYNVYRGTLSGGPYSKINATLSAGTSYSDSSVVSGQTYFYVVTAVDSSNQESGYSNQAQAVIPTP